MRNQVLKIDEMAVSQCPIEYVCYGLGSCIGLFVTERSTGVSGGVHIALPYPLQSCNYKDAGTQIDLMLREFKSMGCDLSGLRAKVVGGAQVLSNTHSLGQDNTSSVFKHLTERKIFVAATDVGGAASRTARFNSRTNELTISTSDAKMYTI